MYHRERSTENQSFPSNSNTENSETENSQKTVKGDTQENIQQHPFIRDETDGLVYHSPYYDEQNFYSLCRGEKIMVNNHNNNLNALKGLFLFYFSALNYDFNFSNVLQKV